MESQCIGLTLAMEMKERGIKSKYYWVIERDFIHSAVNDGTINGCKFEFLEHATVPKGLIEAGYAFAAPTYFDILVTYAEELFGDGYEASTVSYTNYETGEDAVGITGVIMLFLQQGKKEEADQCILEAIKNNL